MAYWEACSMYSGQLGIILACWVKIVSIWKCLPNFAKSFPLNWAASGRLWMQPLDVLNIWSFSNKVPEESNYKACSEFKAWMSSSLSWKSVLWIFPSSTYLTDLITCLEEAFDYFFDLSPSLSPAEILGASKSSLGLSSGFRFDFIWRVPDLCLLTAGE